MELNQQLWLRSDIQTSSSSNCIGLAVLALGMCATPSVGIWAQGSENALASEAVSVCVDWRGPQAARDRCLGAGLPLSARFAWAESAEQSLAGHRGRDLRAAPQAAAAIIAFCGRRDCRVADAVARAVQRRAPLRQLLVCKPTLNVRHICASRGMWPAMATRWAAPRHPWLQELVRVRADWRICRRRAWPPWCAMYSQIDAIALIVGGGYVLAMRGARHRHLLARSGRQLCVRRPFSAAHPPLRCKHAPHCETLARVLALARARRFAARARRAAWSHSHARTATRLSRLC